MTKQTITSIIKRLHLRGWAYGLFWSWNLIFLAFMSLGFAPQLLPEMITAVRVGQIPAAFLVTAGLLTAIPALAVILGLTILRRYPGRLLALGYGVEGPLMLLLAVRFFVVRELILGVALLLAMAGLGLATYLWQLLDRNIDRRGLPLTYLRAIGLTLLLLTGLYAGVWLAFYALPLAVWGWNTAGEVLRNMWTSLTELDWGTVEWRWLPFFVLGLTLLAYTATLFVGMPLAMLMLYSRAWWQGLRTLTSRYGWLPAVALTLMVLGGSVLLIWQTNQQPQHRAFALLETPPANPTEAQALLEQEEAIRVGLLNAYLASQRYLSAVGEVRHVSDMYHYALNMPLKQAEGIQQLYEMVARPVLYEPVNPPQADDGGDNVALLQESAQAAELYQTYFDQPINEGEREAVIRAVRSTWSIDQARASLQAVDDREVLLIRQELNLTEHGDWAEVELYEVYQNQTAQRQEVVYYFSLPESAVVTGVWLGNSSDRQARFAYQVAPRGAAQAVYQNEIRYNMDPALLEQIGPRQYRLRIFPVEPQRLDWDESSGRSTFEAGPPLHMWLTWRVLADDNAWPMPRLAEKRNVYWDSTSVRLINGQPLTVEGEAWLPAAAPAAAPVKAVTHRVDFANGQSVVVRPVSPGALPELDNNLRLAVVLDRSRSMSHHSAEVKAALARLAEMMNAGATVEVYLTASKYRGEVPSRVALADLNPENIMYYGGQNAAELLAQFASLRAGQAYDAILVLTDGSGYELGEGDVVVPVPDAPVWMIHLGDDFSLGYDDHTLEAIQSSGGGVVGDIEEALTRLRVALQAGHQGTTSSPAIADVIDGYVWLVVPTGLAAAETGSGATVEAAGDGFAAFAARRLILAEMYRRRGALDQLPNLDYLHALAIEHSLVTPYSSMIVLVNNDQQRLLDQLERRGDRFQREYEEVGETMPQNPFSVTGVPEPHEWLLLALAVVMLVWWRFSRRRIIQPRY
jgi:putative PEP-CTERM system integral membrane protein